jgi:hypothetical protein
MTNQNEVKNLIEQAGGTVKSMTVIDGDHGIATASFPLPTDHWLYKDDGGFDAPPMPFRMGKNDPRRLRFEDAIRAAARYAVRASTMKGKDEDFDPDAMVWNMIVGLLGYNTPNGLSADEWANPDILPPIFGE